MIRIQALHPYINFDYKKPTNIAWLIIPVFISFVALTLYLAYNNGLDITPAFMILVSIPIIATFYQMLDGINGGR